MKKNFSLIYEMKKGSGPGRFPEHPDLNTVSVDWKNNILPVM